MVKIKEYLEFGKAKKLMDEINSLTDYHWKSEIITKDDTDTKLKIKYESWEVLTAEKLAEILTLVMKCCVKKKYWFFVKDNNEKHSFEIEIKIQ